MKGHLVNDCDFLKFLIFVAGGHCVHSPWAQITLATPLGKEGNVTFCTVCVCYLTVLSSAKII